MSEHRTDPAMLREEQVTTEEELHEKWKNHPSPFVQGVLEWRRKHAADGGEFLTLDEINREVARRRGRDEDS